jgi:phage gp36-like protein
MAYATQVDLKQVGISSEVTAGVTSSDLDAALQRASDWCDGYLRKVYTLPIVAVTGDLKRATCMIAAWDILGAIVGFSPEDAANIVWRQRYEDAIKWLEGVAAGKIDAGLTDSTAGVEEGGPVVSTSTPRGW